MAKIKTTDPTAAPVTPPIAAPAPSATMPTKSAKIDPISETIAPINQMTYAAVTAPGRFADAAVLM
ncbi:hypothetical protein GCM10028798_01400 [Humibacter antri]